MEKRRNCCIVIEQMLEKVPSTETELIKDLKWNHEDASYKAPEQNLQWIRTTETLSKHIPSPIEDWHFEVVSIFSKIPVNDIKEMVKKNKV